MLAPLQMCMTSRFSISHSQFNSTTTLQW